MEFANVLLETNDLSFLPLLLHSNDPEISSTPCLWKIVRDVDVRGTTVEASIVMAGNLIVYSMGPACLIGADRERREILAFIGRDVDAHCFQESVLPALCRLTEFVTRPQDPAAPSQAEVPAGGTRAMRDRDLRVLTLAALRPVPDFSRLVSASPLQRVPASQTLTLARSKWAGAVSVDSITETTRLWIKFAEHFVRGTQVAIWRQTKSALMRCSTNLRALLTHSIGMTLDFAL